jgi:hypothetical protein
VWCGNTANAYSVVQIVTRPERNELIVETFAFIDGGPDNKCSQHVSATGPISHQSAVTYEDVRLSKPPYLAHGLLVSLQNALLELKNEIVGLPVSTMSHSFCGGVPMEN